VWIEELTEANLPGAPQWGGGSRGYGWCLYWQEPDPGEAAEGEALARKRAWLRQVRGEWGGCDKILYQDGEPIGYAQYAPARFLPTAAEYPAGPVSGDAVLLACLFIAAPDRRRRGLGSLLLSKITEELRRRGIAAVETYARRGSPDNPSGPVGLYIKHGFRVIQEDPEFPRLRLEFLRRTC